MGPTTERTRTSPAGGLRLAAVGFAVAAVLHNADHLRRGLGGVTTELQVAGYAAMALSALAVVVVLVGHRTAPIVAVAAGFPLAAGFAASHWLPHWSALSDPFVDGGAAVVSIVASLLEIAGALWLGAAGLRVLRHDGLARAAW
ncbi:MAG TPA: hypothetical protein VHK88_08615 [Aquihabitans sp.]|nr:hypothetical protein [Aquihabitans sp.]